MPYRIYFNKDSHSKVFQNKLCFTQNREKIIQIFKCRANILTSLSINQETISFFDKVKYRKTKINVK